MCDCPPVLLLIFNRPDLLARVFEAVRAAKPGRLYLAADGPRSDREGELELCEEARSFASKVDWPCTVRTLFREVNLGCKRAVSGAIDWFFEHEEEGIILEDDCVPDPSFFPFCAELLNRYRDDKRIGMISGDNFLPSSAWNDGTWSFTRFTFVWGWATWRRAWKNFDGQLLSWPRLKATNWLQDMLPEQRFEYVEFWKERFERCYRGRQDSWAYPWTYSCWRAGQVCVVPGVNLVTNIGFDERATHTRSRSNKNAVREIRPISFPLSPPAGDLIDNHAETKLLDGVYGLGKRRWSKRFKRGLRTWKASVSKAVERMAEPVLPEPLRTACVLRRLRKAPRFQAGSVRLGRRDWYFPDSRSFAQGYAEIFGNEIYRFKCARRAPRIIDCGANVGIASVYLKALYPDAEVVAIEADPSVFSFLRRNIAASGAGGIEAINKAVWHRPGWCSFSTQGADGGKVGDVSGEALRVEAVLLEDLVSGRPVDFLKIDIEGAEVDLLINQAPALEWVSRLFVEYHSVIGSPQRLDELLGVLRNHGFRYQLHPEFHSSHPLVERIQDAGMDQRLNIFAWKN